MQQEPRISVGGESSKTWQSKPLETGVLWLQFGMGTVLCAHNCIERGGLLHRKANIKPPSVQRGICCGVTGAGQCRA